LQQPQKLFQKFRSKDWFPRHKRSRKKQNPREVMFTPFFAVKIGSLKGPTTVALMNPPSQKCINPKYSWFTIMPDTPPKKMIFPFCRGVFSGSMFIFWGALLGKPFSLPASLNTSLP